MLFNSVDFLLFFLPTVLCAFTLLNTRGDRRYGAYLLVAASLFFYGWWNYKYLALILFSITANYLFGLKLAGARSKHFLAASVGFNIVLLAYFKYTNFFVDNINSFTSSSITIQTIVLPLGISFFTFTQIAFLVDAYKGLAKECSFVDYILFVTYFPHLIAGPVIHHKDMMPQFIAMRGRLPSSEMVSHGLMLLLTGLFKKVFIADSLARYVDPAFSNIGSLQILDAWTATLAYTLQLYFDFSAYSEMAMGISLFFGVKLPINFNSPYRAADIAEFWKRWHMTLSRFLKDYLYIPLGGNRHGMARMYLALMLTMLLGGFWHGAGWQYVAWGGLHGAYLVIHKVWASTGRKMNEWAGRVVTFVSVMLAWDMFRASSLDDCFRIWERMFGLNGITLPSLFYWQHAFKVESSSLILGYELFVLALIAYFCMTAKNIHQVIADEFQPSLKWAGGLAGMSLVSFFSLNTPTSFQYFQF